MESPDKARPEEASAIQTDEPEAPGPVQPEGKLAAAVAAEVAEAAADVMVLAAPATTAVRSAFKLVNAEGRAKRVKADDPPHMVVLSPLQAMLPLGEVFERAEPCSRTLPQ